MTNKEIAKLADVGVSTVARMKKKPGWPGTDDPEKLVQWINATKGRAGRPKKGEEKNPTKDEADEVYKLNIEYKRSQIEKNNTTTHGYQLKIIQEYRQKMIKGCNESMSILFKAIKQLDLGNDELKHIKAAVEEAREHLKGFINE